MVEPASLSLSLSLPQFHAMDTLHQSLYDINKATSRLVPRGPVLCADELESWTQGMIVARYAHALVKRYGHCLYAYCHTVLEQRRQNGLRKGYKTKRTSSTSREDM